MKACKRGHTSGRYKSGACIGCMALRKGKPGRKVPPTRVDIARKIILKAAKLTKEEVKLRKETARAERLRLKTENDATARALREYEHSRLAAKERARFEGFSESLGAYSPDAAVARIDPAHSPPPPERGYFTSIERSTGEIDRIALPPARAADAPKVAVSDSAKPGEVRPVWMREGRNATRAEWLQHQRARGAEHKQHSGPAFSDRNSRDWFARACESRRNRGGGL